MTRKFLLLRLILALLVGLCVFVISSFTAWKLYSEQIMTNTSIDGWTRRSLRDVSELIAEHIQQVGSPPETLREIAPSLTYRTFSNSKIRMVKNGLPIDGWGRPLEYSVNETSYTLVSYGRDGKPGGAGFDRDLNEFNYSSSPLDYDDEALWANPPTPSLRQFYFQLPTGGMLNACILSGLITFVAAFFLIRPGPMDGERIVRVTVAIAVTILATVFFGTVIMQLHIPTGH